MNEIGAYELVTGDEQQLVRKVKKLMQDGFQPLGGVASCANASQILYAQAMVKYASASGAKTKAA